MKSQQCVTMMADDVFTGCVPASKLLNPVAALKPYSLGVIHCL